MKKNVDIKKKIDFSSMIGEITAISLENHLEFVSDDKIEGKLLILGKYKETAASTIEEDFRFDVPVEISLTNQVDRSTGKIDIVDFYYDIIEGNSILCHIEISVEGEEYLEERECDGDSKETKEIEIPHLEEGVPTREEVDLEEEDQKGEQPEEFIFNIDSSKETYGSFVVYIVRQNETINTIMEKYHTSLEEIEKYNDIKDLSIGTKIIIPILNDENTK